MEINQYFEAEVRHAARDLMGHYNFMGGYQPGSFRTALFSLWERADRSNKFKLAQAFPAEGAAIEALESQGESGLRRLAEANNV